MAFNYSRRVYLGDTDAARVMYFARGMEICHEAYEESLAVAGISLQQMIIEGTIALPIVHAEIYFRRPIFCGDLLRVSLVVDRVKDSEFAIAYQIFNATNSDKVLVKAQTNHVCINLQYRTRVDLPLAIVDWLAQTK